MKIFFSGQRSFGAASLQAILSAGHTVMAVSAPLADARGRYDVTYSTAERLGLPIARGSGADMIPGGADLIVCAHSHSFISGRARGKTLLGAIGYHPSLLPLHRGRDAVRWTIKMGDRVAGGSVYWLSDSVDCGPVAAQEWCFVRPGDDASSLWGRELFPMGVRLLLRVLAELDNGVLPRSPQDESLATWEPSWDRPPLFRPDVPLLGEIQGYRVTTELAR